MIDQNKYAKEIAERIKLLAKRCGLPVCDILQECGLHAGFVNHMISRGSIPGADQFIKIAQYFNVSVDYILGVEKKHSDGGVLAELNAIFKKLDISDASIKPEDREAFFNYIETSVSLYQQIKGK